MAKGPDPRTSAKPRQEVPALLKAGATEWNARRFWHAHEAWEEAWHSLRAAGETAPAEWLHGLILAAAALENATRGKEAGSKRQFAEGLFLLRTHQEGAAALGLHDGQALLDALFLLYVDACRRLSWADWNASGWTAPEVRFA